MILENRSTGSTIFLKSHLENKFLEPTLRNKTFSLINIIGLVIGLVCTFFILIYIINETSYDKHNEKRAQIYRMLSTYDEFDFATTLTPYQLASTLKSNFPEIISATKVARYKTKIKKGNSYIQENYFQFADNELFNILSFSIIKGDSDKLLTTPNSVVISEKMVKKYFEKENPLGKVLTANIYGQQYELIVTGIIKDIPKYSTFKADFIGNVDLVVNIFKNRFKNPSFDKDWRDDSFTTYILLTPDLDINTFINKIDAFSETILPETLHNKKFDLQNLNDVYLKSSHLSNNFLPSGNITTLYVFSIIAFSILLIASLNYIILSTFLYTTRFKEIGIKKVFGANNVSLMKQILIETFLISFIALVISYITVIYFLPFINVLFGYEIIIEQSKKWQYILGFISITLLVNLISGIYVSFYTSLQQPVDIFSMKLNTRKKISLKNILITVQLFIFIILIISTFIITKQIRYAQNKDLGFNKNNILIIYFNSDKFKAYEAFKNEIRTHPGIVNISGADYVPPTNGIQTMVVQSFIDATKEVEVEYIGVDYDFIETFEFELTAGRSFSKEFSNDFSKSIILNEKAVNELEISDPIGKIIDGKKIVGILKDFHIHSFHEKVMPLFFTIDLSDIEEIVIRVNPESMGRTLAFIEKKWNEFSPYYPFGGYQLFNEALDELYVQDKQLKKILIVFTSIAIFIAMLGLFGLSLYVTKRKTKDIIIHKVYGASVLDIVIILSKEFIWLVLIASVLAWPVAYIVMNKWLQGFAFRINIINNLWLFLIAGFFSLIIVLLTISIRTIRTARINPVEALRYE